MATAQASASRTGRTSADTSRVTPSITTGGPADDGGCTRAGAGRSPPPPRGSPRRRRTRRRPDERRMLLVRTTTPAPRPRIPGSSPAQRLNRPRGRRRRTPRSRPQPTASPPRHPCASIPPLSQRNIRRQHQPCASPCTRATTRPDGSMGSARHAAWSGRCRRWRDHPVGWRVKPRDARLLHVVPALRVTRHPPGWDGWLSPEAQLPAVHNDRSDPPLEPDHHRSRRRDWSPPERPMLSGKNRANSPGREIEVSRAQRRDGGDGQRGERPGDQAGRRGGHGRADREGERRPVV